MAAQFNITAVTANAASRAGALGVGIATPAASRPSGSSNGRYVWRPLRACGPQFVRRAARFGQALRAVIGLAPARPPIRPPRGLPLVPRSAGAGAPLRALDPNTIGAVPAKRRRLKEKSRKTVLLSRWLCLRKTALRGFEAKIGPMFASCAARQPAPMLARGGMWVRFSVGPTALGKELGNFATRTTVGLATSLTRQLFAGGSSGRWMWRWIRLAMFSDRAWRMPRGPRHRGMTIKTAQTSKVPRSRPDNSTALQPECRSQMACRREGQPPGCGFLMKLCLAGREPSMLASKRPHLNCQPRPLSALMMAPLHSLVRCDGSLVTRRQRMPTRTIGRPS